MITIRAARYDFEIDPPSRTAYTAMGPEQWVCVSTLTNNGVALQPPKT
jgi:hypothetical protein